jgi:hypothetical protein
MMGSAAPGVTLLTPGDREPASCVMKALGAVRRVSSNERRTAASWTIAEVDLIPARGMP